MDGAIKKQLMLLVLLLGCAAAYESRAENYGKWYDVNSATGTSVYAADVDGDNATEILTAGMANDGMGDNFFLNISAWNGTTLTTEYYNKLYDGAATGRSVYAADVDSDGVVEILMLGQAGKGSSFLNISRWDGATLTTEYYGKWQVIGNTESYSIYAADVDGDGKKEILIAGDTYDGLRWVAFLNIAYWNGTALTTEYSGTWYDVDQTIYYSVYATDVDGDRAVEILTTGSAYNLTRANAFLNISHWDGGTLTTEYYGKWYDVGDTRGYSIYAADVDNDSNTEILIAGDFVDGVRNNAFLNISCWDGSSFTAEYYGKWYDISYTYGKSVFAADVDGDAQTEILVAGNANDGMRYNAFLNISRWDGSILTNESYSKWYDVSGTEGNSLYATDVDGDRAVEILTTGSTYDGIRTNAFLNISMPVFRATGVPAGLILKLPNGTDISTATQPLGVQTVYVDTGGAWSTIAALTVNFSGGDMNFTGLVANDSVADNKAVLHMPSWPTQVASNKTLYVPGNGTGWVHVCPDATTLAEVNDTCPGGYDAAAAFNGTNYNVTVAGSGGMEIPAPPGGNVTGGTGIAYAAPESPLAVVTIFGIAVLIWMAFTMLPRR
jgi:hypothetical protein